MEKLAFDEIIKEAYTYGVALALAEMGYPEEVVKTAAVQFMQDKLAILGAPVPPKDKPPRAPGPGFIPIKGSNNKELPKPPNNRPIPPLPDTLKKISQQYRGTQYTNQGPPPGTPVTYGKFGPHKPGFSYAPPDPSQRSPMMEDYSPNYATPPNFQQGTPQNATTSNFSQGAQSLRQAMGMKSRLQAGQELGQPGNVP